MPVTCPKCGRETGRQEKFCENCGAFLGWEEGESADSQVFPQQAPQQGGDQRASVRVQIKDDLIEVAPGNAESTTFTVKNLGTQVEQFRSVVTGPDWLAIEPPTMTVYPGDEATGTIQAAPPRKPGSAAGVTPFRLTVTSALHAHVSSSASGRVDVAPYHELAAELVPTSSTGRGLTRHHITLDNRGNTPLRITLNPTDVADGLRLGVPAAADVPPGTVTEVPVSVYGTRRWIGRPEPKTFAIIAEPPRPLAPARLPGTRTVIPVFPRWVPVAAAALLAAAIAATTLIPKLTAHNKAANPPPATTPARTQASAAPSPRASSSSPPPTSAPPPSSPVPVPNVTGETLQQAATDLSSKNLKPQPRASWVSPPAVAWNIARTDPTAGASASPGSTVQVYVPTGTVELMPISPSAQWTATSQYHPPLITLTFGGNETDNTGAALLTGTVTLENGAAVTQALETHPPPLTGGYIKGVYPLSPAAIDGQQFRADIGFRKGTGGMIQYQVIAIGGNGSQQILDKATHDAGTGQLKPVKVNLPAGTTAIALVVTALDNAPANDDVIWANPRIEEANAPPEPLQPTASATPPASTSGP